ncbi:MAG TPA: proliferating cell nuclear antigen (pcna) [Nanoarchaeota archaeon]|nr:proliferating cell nuclear antigen (pcna) [Nanoarchaeota archaeon]
MRFTLADSRLLRESVNIISELVTEVTFKVSKSGIDLLAIDPANVAMVDFKLTPAAFTEFETEKDMDLSVNLENLKAILKRSKPEDTIIVSLDKDKNRLTIDLTGSGKRTFNLSLIDYDREQQKLPNLKFNAKITVPASKLDDAIADMGIVSDSVALIASNTNFTMKAEGNLSDAKVDFPACDDTVISLGKEEEVMAKYAIEYLAKMARGSKLADEVSLSFANDYPLRVEYNVQGKLHLGFVLAPRVSND